MVQEFVHESAKIAFPDGEGQYFATVIAYNHALSPQEEHSQFHRLFHFYICLSRRHRQA
jgi:hypothetical protein